MRTKHRCRTILSNLLEMGKNTFYYGWIPFVMLMAGTDGVNAPTFLQLLLPTILFRQTSGLLSSLYSSRQKKLYFSPPKFDSSRHTPFAATAVDSLSQFQGAKNITPLIEDYTTVGYGFKLDIDRLM